MKITEMRQMSKVELTAKLKELQEKKFKLAFKHKTTMLKNTMELSNIKKEIARINTIIKELK